MILIAGIPSEPPVAYAIEAAEAAGVACLVFDQRMHAETDLALDFDPRAGWHATLTWPGCRIGLEEITGAYVRLMDDAFLPGMPGLPALGPERSRARNLHALLHAWFDIAPGRVANRPAAMMSNMSKTYQAVAIRAAGFRVPETLATNDPDAVLAFVAHCALANDEVVYKSLSGTRSIVQTFVEEDRARLDRIRWCPTQFQRRVRGTDIRVHVVGRRTFAVRIESDATDYRYAFQQSGVDAELSPFQLPAGVATACVDLAAALDLPFTGIDLMTNAEGDYYCFEANPSPAYSYYQSRTGLPIADALVRWLAGAED